MPLISATRLCSFHICVSSTCPLACFQYRDSKNFCAQLVFDSALFHLSCMVEISRLANMSASESSPTASPRWLSDKATRLVQSAFPKQHKLTEKLVTPVMSEIELNVRTLQSLAHFNANRVRHHPPPQARHLLHLWSLFLKWHISTSHKVLSVRRHENRSLAEISSSLHQPVAHNSGRRVHLHLAPQVINLHH
jgi:hypothetical protein